jgi:two-component system chemotaxis sensor kinase CheA
MSAWVHEGTTAEHGRSPDEIIDELGSCLLLADGSSTASLSPLRALFDELHGALGGAASPPEDLGAARACLELFDAAGDDPGKVADAITRASEALTALQARRHRPVERDEETLAMFGEFLQETEEGLAKADAALMDVERGDDDPETVNGLFRVFHTIKGTAGFVDAKEVTALAHTTETMLNLVRQHTLEFRGPVLDLVFDATAMMRRLLVPMRVAVETRTEIAPTAELPALLGHIEAAIQGQAPAPAPEPPPPPKPTEELWDVAPVAPVSTRPEAAPVVQAPRPQAHANAPAQAKLQDTIKIDLARVDNLVEMIGELVIAESMVVHSPEVTSQTSPKFRAYIGQLTKIARDLQDVGTRMRMVPVRGAFQKMARLVRDLSRKSGKEIQLVQSGEGTEMDRSMVEQIGDPLIHMIRNAIDHGIDTAEERLKAGKPAAGTIRLGAYHEGGGIVIEVGDDGRGLDRDAILRKARAQGLVKDEQSLTDSEIYSLIFAPGFSTAKQVTELSGRGVGMDVVRRNIEAMRGRVTISTVPGQGTTFKLILPLTLAIIDAMLVECGRERYLIPTLSIVQSIQPTASMLGAFAGSAEIINVRGEVLPLLRLDRLFNVAGAKQDATCGLVVILETVGRKVGLLVDEVVTQQQVVMKSFGDGLHHVRAVSGAAILSDGRVGLILNVDEIASLAGPAGAPVNRYATRNQEMHGGPE